MRLIGFNIKDQFFSYETEVDQRTVVYSALIVSVASSLLTYKDHCVNKKQITDKLNCKSTILLANCFFFTFNFGFWICNYNISKYSVNCQCNIFFSNNLVYLWVKHNCFSLYWRNPGINLWYLNSAFESLSYSTETATLASKYTLNIRHPFSQIIQILFLLSAPKFYHSFAQCTVAN